MLLKTVALGGLVAFTMIAPRPADVPFRATMIDSGASETAAVADINRDGRLARQ